VTDFGHQLNVTQDEGERLRRLCQLMLGAQFRGGTAAVLRVARDGSADPQVRCGPTVAPNWHQPMPPVSRSVLKVLCDTPEPVLATNYGAAPATNARIELSTSPDLMAMSVIAIPLRFDERMIDVLYVVFSPEYGHADWLALAALAVKQYQQAESVWLHVGTIREYAAVERELERAQEIQQRLIPHELRIKGLDLAIGFRPCHWVGGDYADVVPMSDGRTLLIVADVCGKGLSAALVASSLHTVVHGGVRAGKDLLALIKELNQYLLEDLGGESLVTIIGVALDPATGAFECINCGHPPGLILDREGNARQFQSATNPMLGIEDLPVKVQSGVIGRLEMFALFTDGLTELFDRDEKMLDVEGLEKGLVEQFMRSPGASAAEYAEGLTRFLDEYQGGRAAGDDRTFLLGRLS
jgi:serine phosphatase RsbU (regulator of sigma subunit)